VADENTHTIVLFIEGIRKPEHFMEAAGRALAAGKPIIAIKTGRSESGREAALSHSGAVSGDYAVYEAVCERYGIVNCASLDDMIETTLAFQSRRFPKGPNIAFMTTSGGTVDLLHDYVEAEGASMPELAPDTVAAISELVSPEVAVRNPIDTGSPIGATNRTAPMKICKAMAADPGIDMVAWALNIPGTARGASNPEMVAELLAATDKPVVAFARISHMVNEAGLAFQDETGLSFLQGVDTTVRALGALWFFARRRGRNIGALPEPAGRAENTSGTALQIALADAGIPAPRSIIAATPEDAARAAAEIGFPVALKIVSPAISHKTEIGGVKLDLRDRDEVGRAAVALEAAARTALATAAQDASIEGFLVQEMTDGIEILVGARDDPMFGPLIVVGAGGVLVELAGDVALRLLPVTEDDVRAMLIDLRVRRLLDGFRGAKPADVDALVRTVCAVGAFYLDHRTWLADLEINPLMVRGAGGGVAAVDIRAVPRRGPAA
jgi:acyl-CoA synthetase (NDP forming)